MTDITVARHEAAHMVVALAVGSAKVQGWLENIPAVVEEDFMAGFSVFDDKGVSDENGIVICLAPEVYDKNHYEDYDQPTVGQMLETGTAGIEQELAVERERDGRSKLDHVDTDKILKKYHKKVRKRMLKRARDKVEEILYQCGIDEKIEEVAKELVSVKPGTRLTWLPDFQTGP